FFLFYFVFAVGAFVRASWSEVRPMAPMALACIYITLLYLPLHVEPRYSVPCMPGLIALCTIGLWKTGTWLARRRRGVRLRRWGRSRYADYLQSRAPKSG